MASSSSDTAVEETDYKRERRPTMSQYVRNHLWWVEWTPCCHFRLRKQTFFNYYKMSRKSIRQEDIAASSTAPDTDGTAVAGVTGSDTDAKESTYGVMLDFMYSILETKKTGKSTLKTKKQKLIVEEEDEIDMTKRGVCFLFHFTPKKYCFFSIFMIYMMISWILFAILLSIEVIRDEDRHTEFHNFNRFEFATRNGIADMMHLVTSRELFLKATDQLKCENGTAVYVKDVTDLVRERKGSRRKQGPESIQSFYDHEAISAIFSMATKIGCAEILCDDSYVMLCKYEYVPDALVETIEFLETESKKKNPRPPLLTRDELIVHINKREKYLSKCVRKRHPVTDLCVNSCDYSDRSFFCASVSKAYCEISSVLEKCGGTCKCSADSLSFRANKSDDYVRALNDFRINYFGSNVNNLEQNIALQEKARVIVGACTNFKNEWHFVSENFTTFMDEKMKWYDNYTAKSPPPSTDKFASGLINEQYKSVGCSYEYCTNKFVYLCLFE